MSVSVTPPMQNKGRCRQRPRLPSKVKVDVTPYHVCTQDEDRRPFFPSITSWLSGVLVAQLVSRHSCVADRLLVVVRFPAGPRVSLKWTRRKAKGADQKKIHRLLAFAKSINILLSMLHVPSWWKHGPKGRSEQRTHSPVRTSRPK